MEHHEHKHAAPPADEKAITEGLAAIYGEERDDLATLEKAGSRATRYLTRAVVVLAITAAAAFLAFFAYLKFFATPGEDPFTLAIETPADAVSGSTVTVTIRYENTGNVPIASAAIDVNLPDVFVPSAMEPQPTDVEELVWNIGAMDRKEQGAIVLTGTWLASVPSTKNIQALAAYRPANFNADFDAVATTSVTTLTSALALTAAGPETIMAGEAATYTFVVTNGGSLPMARTLLALDLPDGFFVDAAVPALAAGEEALWALGDLAPAATQTVTVTGSFASSVSDVQQLRATALVETLDAQLSQAEASAFTDVAGNGLVIQLVGNGTADDVTMDPGDPLRITVGYKNTGETALAGITFLVDFQADGSIPIAWSEATLDGGRMTADGVRFDNLSLAVGEEKSKNLIFPVRSELAPGEMQAWSVVVHATTQGGVTIKSQPLAVLLNSDTSFTAVARYYDEDGAPFGSGPLPPTVGATTEYELVWTITNELHGLKDARASATLPANVTWVEGAADYGSVEWDPGTRTILWSSPSMAAGADAVRAVLRVAITPDADDVGAFVKLLSGSSFRATDTVTGSTIQQTSASLSTECEGDAWAEGKGFVTE